jgi:hypothetical protein
MAKGLRESLEQSLPKIVEEAGDAGKVECKRRSELKN